MQIHLDTFRAFDIRPGDVVIYPGTRRLVRVDRVEHGKDYADQVTMYFWDGNAMSAVGDARIPAFRA